MLQKDETVATVGILQNEGGHQPPSQRGKYDDFRDRQTIDYLRSIAHTLAD